MKRTLLASACLALAALLAGCGNSTDNLNFKVPSGYENKLNTFVFSIWSKGDEKNPAGLIMLFKIPGVKQDLSKFKNRDFVGSTGNFKNMKLEQKQDITICGSQPALLLKGSGQVNSKGGQSSDYEEQNLEMLVTNAGDTTYMAMYTYPLNAKPDAQSEAAIKSVCLKSAS